MRCPGRGLPTVSHGPQRSSWGPIPLHWAVCWVWERERAVYSLMSPAPCSAPKPQAYRWPWWNSVGHKAKQKDTAMGNWLVGKRRRDRNGKKGREGGGVSVIRMYYVHVWNFKRTILIKATEKCEYKREYEKCRKINHPAFSHPDTMTTNNIANSPCWKVEAFSSTWLFLDTISLS